MSLKHTQALRLLNVRLKHQRRQKSLDKLTIVVGNALLKAAYGSWGQVPIGVTPSGDIKFLKVPHGS